MKLNGSYQINLEKQKIQKAINALKIIKNPGVFQKNANITIYEFFDYNKGNLGRRFKRF